MSLSSISIRRPVLATVFSLVILLFGVIGWNFLGVREYPSVDPPKVTVSTTYTGANADVIETQITEPLEESINGIEGIKTLTSVSRDGRSTITVEFDLSSDLDNAANDVRDKVSQAVRDLPEDADPPVVSKADADSRPIIFLNIKSDKRSLLELTEIAERDFKERLQTIPGVSEIRIWGEKKYSMRLWLDPAKMAAYKITPMDVRNALLEQNIELPTGRIEGRNVELSVRTIGRLTTPEEFNELVIKESDDRLVLLKDVGYAILGPENERTSLKRDGIPMVGNAIVPQPNSNHIEIADEFYRRLEQIKKDLPEDIETGIGFDTTEYIRDSIEEVKQTIYLAFFMVILVIFLFLRDWRSTIIPVIVIPIALIGSFFVMYIAEFSINVLTLLGLVLAIGLVVDDAIVVLENIYSKIEAGMSSRKAAKEGAAEIFFAVIATTLALAAVFMPVIFLEGVTGRLFREFGVVIAGAVIISSFVALTLTPMLSANLLKKQKKRTPFYVATESFYNKLTAKYRSSLDIFLKNRWVGITIMILSFGLIYIFGANLSSELAPLEDRGNLRVVVSAPEGSTYDFMSRYMDKMVALIQDEIPEADGIISVTSPGFGASSSVNSGFVRLRLTPSDERKRSQQEIASLLTQDLKSLPEGRAFVAQEQTIGDSRGGLPVQYVIQAPNLDKLKEILPEFMKKAAQSEVFSIVDLDLKFNKPELKVTIDREKALAMGVSVQNIAQTLQLTLSGQRFDFFIMNGKQYQVIGQLDRYYRDEPSDLTNIYVRNDQGDMIALENLVNLTEQATPPQLYRYNRYVSATVSADLANGYTLGDGIEEMNRISSGTLSSSFSTALAGTSKEFEESSSSIYFAFLLALIIIYLVLSAQFESFRDPLIIMFTVPLALAGALGSLYFFGETLNIFSQIGMIMLIGLVTKNGILIVEFANQRKADGLNQTESILDASASRFRPILMTSLSTVLGTLPIALALGAGSESRVSMGIVVIGGLIFSTILTLYVIPTIYTFISSDKKYVSNVDDE
ncbi:MAG: acriflavin resistance protein [Flavobacteriales bacterium]|nr:acriflavin resistance protein [Flavobacteriales bacterium]|tara:strand:- start:39654 stop:42719 length:3066 start_codon:yes stop_codon:yes gene_type:complete